MLAAMLVLCGCKRQEPVPTEDTSNGPVVPQDTRTPEEKELAMIQQCISDYNEGNLEEIEENLLTQIPRLPIGIEKLPEIQALSDLEQIEIDTKLSNIAYKGSYAVSDDITAVFEIYHPTGGIFWINGDVKFCVDPEKITRNDPQYSDYKNTLDYLLTEQDKVLDWLYGIDVVLSENEVSDRYYEVVALGNWQPKSIDDIKEYAENIINKQFLEERYYPGAFAGEMPIYKEINGHLCALQSDVTGRPRTFDTSTIFAAEDTGEYTRIELLLSVMGKTQPEIQEVKIYRDGDRYKLYEPA